MVGQWCGSVGRGVDSDTRGPRFGFSHWQIFIKQFFTVSLIEKAKIKKKEAGNGLKNKKIAINLYNIKHLNSSSVLCIKCIKVLLQKGLLGIKCIKSDCKTGL